MEDIFDVIAEEGEIEICQEVHDDYIDHVPNWTFEIETPVGKSRLVTSVISFRLNNYIFKDKSEIKYNVKSVEQWKNHEIITIDIYGEFNSISDANDFIELFFIGNMETSVTMIVTDGEFCIKSNVMYYDKEKYSVETFLYERKELIKLLYKGVCKHSYGYSAYVIIRKNIDMISNIITAFITEIGYDYCKYKLETIDCEFKHRYSFKNLKKLLYNISDFDVAVKLYAASFRTYAFNTNSKHILIGENWFIKDNFAYSSITIHTDSGMYYSIYEPFHGYTKDMVDNIDNISTGVNTMHRDYILKKSECSQTTLIMFCGLIYSNEPVLTAIVFKGDDIKVQNALNFLQENG